MELKEAIINSPETLSFDKYSQFQPLGADHSIHMHPWDDQLMNVTFNNSSFYDD